MPVEIDRTCSTSIADQFGTPQRAGEADEQQRPIPGTGKIVAAYPDQSLDLRSGQGG